MSIYWTYVMLSPSCFWVDFQMVACTKIDANKIDMKILKEKLRKYDVGAIYILNKLGSNRRLVNTWIDTLVMYFQNSWESTLQAECSRDDMQKTNDIYSMFNPVTGRYHCPQCRKTYSSRTGLRLHYQGHIGSYSYWCDSCSKGFTVKSNYDGHMTKHAGITFPCNECEKIFSFKKGLDAHFRKCHQ